MDDAEKKKRTLPEQWSSYLLEQGESGMGYQVVDIVLNDGTLIKDVAIIESHFIGQIRGYKGPMPPFGVRDIAEIRLTHNRWNFNEE